MDSKPDRLELICGKLTQHKLCKSLGNGYWACQICGKVYETVMPLPGLTDPIIKEMEK